MTMEQYFMNQKGEWIDTVRYYKEADTVFIKITGNLFKVVSDKQHGYRDREYITAEDVAGEFNTKSGRKSAIFEQNEVRMIHANFELEEEE